MSTQIDYGRVIGYSAYEQAVAGGYTGTEEEYEALLASYATTALKAEGYAVGKQNGVDVTSGSDYYHNNSKYYSEEAADSATAAETAAASATAAYGTTLLAPTYSTSGTYAVGDYCIYDGNMYRCTTAISSGEAWTSGHWTQVAVGSEVGTLKSAINKLADYEHVDFLEDAVWGIGTISTSTGGENDSTTRLRIRTYLEVPENTEVFIEVEEGYKFNVYGYSDTNYSYFTGMVATSVDTGHYTVQANTANYLKMTMWRNDGSTFEDTTESENMTAYTLNSRLVEQVDANTEAIEGLSDDTYRKTDVYTKTEVNTGFSKVGAENFGAYGTFENGGMSSGTKDNKKYRVMTNTIMSFNRDLYVTIAEGFRAAFHSYTGSTFLFDSGWKKIGYAIKAGTKFKVVISRETENTSEIADIPTFVSKVTFPNKTDAGIVEAGKEASYLEKLILDSNIIWYDPCYTIYGGQNQVHNRIEFTGIDATATYGLKIRKVEDATYDGVSIAAYSGTTNLGSSSKRASADISISLDLSSYENVDRLVVDLFASYSTALPATGAKYYDVMLFKGASLTLGINSRVAIPDLYGAENTSRRAYPFYANFTPRYMRKIQHRGLSTVAPANSLPAFEAAGEAGVFGIEFDVHRTQDGYYIICHNDSLDASTDGTGAIADLTYSYVRSCHIDVGTNVEQYTAEQLIVPDLDEVLAICKKYGMLGYIDIKSLSGSAANMVDIIEKIYSYGLEDSVIVSSSTAGYIKKCRELDKRIHIALSANSLTDEIYDEYKDYENMTIAIQSQYSDAADVTKLHKSGLLVDLWVPTTATGEENCRTKGADMVTTEAPVST